MVRIFLAAMLALCVVRTALAQPSVCEDALKLPTLKLFGYQEESDFTYAMSEELEKNRTELQKIVKNGSGGVDIGFAKFSLGIKGSGEAQRMLEIADWLRESKSHYLHGYQYRNLLDIRPDRDITKEVLEQWNQCLLGQSKGLSAVRTCGDDFIVVTVLWRPEGKQEDPTVRAIAYDGCTPLGEGYIFSKGSKIEPGSWAWSFKRTDKTKPFKFDLVTTGGSASTGCDGIEPPPAPPVMKPEPKPEPRTKLDKIKEAKYDIWYKKKRGDGDIYRYGPCVDVDATVDISKSKTEVTLTINARLFQCEGDRTELKDEKSNIGDSTKTRSIYTAPRGWHIVSTSFKSGSAKAHHNKSNARMEVNGEGAIKTLFSQGKTEGGDLPSEEGNKDPKGRAFAEVTIREIEVTIEEDK